MWCEITTVQKTRVYFKSTCIIICVWYNKCMHTQHTCNKIDLILKIRPIQFGIVIKTFVVQVVLRFICCFWFAFWQLLQSLQYFNDFFLNVVIYICFAIGKQKLMFLCRRHLGPPAFFLSHEKHLIWLNVDSSTGICIM